MSYNHQWVPNDGDHAWRAPCSSTHSACVFKKWGIALIVVSVLQVLGAISTIIAGTGAFDTSDNKISNKGLVIGTGIFILFVEVGMIVSTYNALRGLACRCHSHFLPFLIVGMINWILYWFGFGGCIYIISDDGAAYGIITMIVIIIELVIMYFAYMTGYRSYRWLKHMEHHHTMPTQIVYTTAPAPYGGGAYPNPSYYQD